MFNVLPEATSRIVHAPWFQRMIIAVILLAGLLAGIETDAAMVAAHGPLLGVLDAAVLGLFIIEVILKLVSHGFRPWDYFRDGWNVFDFVIVVLCLLPIDSQFAMAMRLGRALRLLRLVSALPKLQLLVGCLVKSFSSMGYVGVLLGLMFYMYAIVGVQLFGTHDKDHFGSLASAFLTLFQTITLDDWKFLFTSASGSSPTIAAIYFVSFILLGTMIMLNLFIGIIMNSMSEMHAEIDNMKQSKLHEMETGTVLIDLTALDEQMVALKSQLSELRYKLNHNKP